MKDIKEETALNKEDLFSMKDTIIHLNKRMRRTLAEGSHFLPDESKFEFYHNDTLLIIHPDKPFFSCDLEEYVNWIEAGKGIDDLFYSCHSVESF